MIGAGCGQVCNVHIYRVLPSFDRVKLCVDGLFPALRVFAHNIFKNDQIARTCHRKVRFCRDDQAECLQIGGYLDRALAIIENWHFSQIRCPTFGCNCPQHVGQVLRPEATRRLKMFELGIDFDSSRPTLDCRSAAGIRHQIRSSEIQRRLATVVLIIHRLRTS